MTPTALILIKQARFPRRRFSVQPGFGPGLSRLPHILPGDSPVTSQTDSGDLFSIGAGMAVAKVREQCK